jgi:hypothetical protein
LSCYDEKEETRPGALEGKGVFHLQIDQTRNKMTEYRVYCDKDRNKIKALNYERKRF